MKEGICILVQGPLRKETVTNVLRNSPLVSQCVVSTWNPVGHEETEILAELRLMEKSIETLTVLVETLDAKQISHIERGGLQFASLRAGLQLVRTETVLKCRSDEEYGLQPFVSQLEKDPGTILFSNFIVRDWNYHPFHISDHLFGAPTALLRTALDRLTSRSSAQIDEILQGHSQTPEVVLGFHLFEACEPNASRRPRRLKREFDQFTKHFNLFDLELLPFYSVNANQAGIKALTNIRSLENFRSEAGYRLNFTHHTKLKHLKPAWGGRSLWTRRLKPYLRAACLRISAFNLQRKL